MPLAYHDNSFVEKSSIMIAASDFGFVRGLTIFDLVRVYGGAPFRLDDHLARLAGGAAAIGLSLPYSTHEIRDIVQRMCAQNLFPHSAVKFYFTAGESRSPAQSFANDHGFTPHLIIIEDEVKPDHPEAPFGLDYYRRGQRLKIVPHERALPSIKSINYMQGFIAARAAGPEWDDILFTYRDGSITEATKSNFFCVIDGILCTPDKNMLYGITRKVILEIAPSLGLKVAERTIMPADLLQASEAFTTGSIAEMIPVRQIDDHVFPATMDAPVFAALRKALSAVIQAAAQEETIYAAEP